MCTTDSSWFLFALAVATLIGCYGWLRRRGIFKSDHILKDEPAYEENGIYEEVILDAGYLRDGIQLAESSLAELSACAMSYEKKALAVMAAALALIGFLLTRVWCFNIAEVFRVISISAGIAATLSAGRAVHSSRIGLKGLLPIQTMRFWQDIQVSAHAEYGNEVNTAENSNTRTDQVSTERRQLYTMMLRRYHRAIETSKQAIQEKAKQFTFSTHCLLIAFFAAIAWLSMTIVQQLI